MNLTSYQNEWYDFIYDDWKETLENAGFINPEIHFSGFWSQGDGACFDAAVHHYQELHKRRY